MQLGWWEDGKVEGCKIFELDDLAQEVLAPDRSTRESEKLRRIRTAKQRRRLARAKEVSRLSTCSARASLGGVVRTDLIHHNGAQEPSK